VKGYLDAVTPWSTTVILAGVPLKVERARLGLHLFLSREAGRVFDAQGTVEDMARHMREYLRLSCGDRLDRATGTEMVAAFVELAALNAPLFSLAFMEATVDKLQPPAYDYPGRGYALWVHRLASRYGWTREQIFDLWPEEFACYLQEIFVSEYDEEDRQRVLSEMAYQYDKATKKLNFRPLPRPAWMVGRKERSMVRINRAYLPMGDVIDLSRLKPKWKGGDA
jgi:hypothetical protein